MRFFARLIHIFGWHWWQYEQLSRTCLGCKGKQVRRHFYHTTYEWYFVLIEEPSQ